MASVLKVDKLDPQSGTALEIGTSGDTITIPSGATIVNSGTATGFGGVNTPIWYVTRAADQALADNTYVKVEWDTEGIDTDSAFASYKFTVPAGAGGIYYISAGVAFYDNTVQNHHYVLIYKNGSAVSAQPTGMTTSDGNTDRYWQTINMSLTLVATDYVEVYALCDFTSGTGTMSASYFTGFKLVQ